MFGSSGGHGDDSASAGSSSSRKPIVARAGSEVERRLGQFKALRAEPFHQALLIGSGIEAVEVAQESRAGRDGLDFRQLLVFPDSTRSVVSEHGKQGRLPLGDAPGHVAGDLFQPTRKRSCDAGFRGIARGRMSSAVTLSSINFSGFQSPTDTATDTAFIAQVASFRPYRA